MKLSFKDFLKTQFTTNKGEKANLVLGITGILYLLMIVCSFGGAAGYLAVEFSDRSKDLQILNDGFRANGVVVEKYFDDEIPKIRYAFRTQDGKSIRGNSKHFNDLTIESDVEIAYNPATPSRNLLVQEGVEPVRDAVLISGLFSTPGILLIIVFIVAYLRRGEYRETNIV